MNEGTLYRGYRLRPGVVFGTVEVWYGDDWVETAVDLQTAKNDIDVWHLAP